MNCVVFKHENSILILNAVSPAIPSTKAFTEIVAHKHIS